MAMPIIWAAVNAAIAAAGVLYVWRVGLLVMRDIVTWFSKRLGVHGKDKLAITVKESIENGDFQLVQGIFDPADDKFTEARRIRAQAVSEEVAVVHRVHEVAVWS